MYCLVRSRSAYIAAMQHESGVSPPQASVPHTSLSGMPHGGTTTVAGRPRLVVVDSRPMVRRLVVDMSYGLGLRAAEAEGAAEALALLGADSGGAAQTVLVVAVGAGRGPDILALAGEAARRRPDAPPLGVVFIGAHLGVLGDRPLGGRERFLAEPFGRPALARAAHEALGWPVPRWLAARRHPAPAPGLG